VLGGEVPWLFVVLRGEVPRFQIAHDAHQDVSPWQHTADGVGCRLAGVGCRTAHRIALYTRTLARRLTPR